MCRGEDRPIERHLIPVDGSSLNVESKYCYIGDMFSVEDRSAKAVIPIQKLGDKEHIQCEAECPTLMSSQL